MEPMRISEAIRWQASLIVVDTVLARVIGLNEAILLCRILWAQPDRSTWIIKSQADFERETSLSPDIQRRAIGKLKARGLIEVKTKRFEHVTLYRVDCDALESLRGEIEDLVGASRFANSENLTSGTGETSLREVGKPEVANSGNTTSPYQGEWQPVTGNQETEEEASPICETDVSRHPGGKSFPKVPPPIEKAWSSSRSLPAGAIAQDDSAPRGGHSETDPGVKTPPRPKPSANPAGKNADAKSGKAFFEFARDEVISAWNIFAESHGLPKVIARSPERLRILTARVKDSFWFENFRGALDQLAGESWYLGQNDRGWRADFDWFIRPKQVAMLIERREAAAARAKSGETAAAATAGPGVQTVKRQETDEEILRKVLG